MGRRFPLAGLVRLRHLQQDQAAAALAAANERLQESGARRERARAALGATAGDATSVEALYAVAAARASTRGMLADLDALRRRRETAQRDAQAEFDEARARSLRLEKLARRHIDALAVEDLHAEQIVLDEIAGTARHGEDFSG